MRALPADVPPGAFEPLEASLRTGIPDLDALAAFRPGALTLVDAPGAPLVEDLYADAAVEGSLVLVADGGNSLDAYRLAAAARRRAAQRWPDAPRRDLAAHEEMALDRVRVARGFTAHQLQSIVEDALPQELSRARDEGLDLGLVAAPSLLDMTLDEDVAREEGRVLAQRALDALRALARRHRVAAVVTGGALPPRSPHPCRALLEEAADEHVALRGLPRGGALLELPRRGARFVLPPRAQQRLDDFAPAFADVASAPFPDPGMPVGASYRNGRLWHPRVADTWGRRPRAEAA